MKTKNIKHLLTLFMSLVCLSASAYDIEVDGIYYKVISVTDFTCAVTYGNKMYEGTLVIPPTIEYKNRTLTVTKIEEDAFSRYGSSSTLRDNAIHSLTIPNTISSISDDALYYCTSLDSLIIQDGDTEIDLGQSSHYIAGALGFFGTYDFQGPLYHIPTSYVYIGRNIKVRRYKETATYYDQFYNSNIKIAEIGDKVTVMPFFYQSKNLNKVTIGKGVSVISDSTFMDCTRLAEVSMSDNVVEIGKCAFYRCGSLKSILLSSNLRKIGADTFFESGLQSIALPEGLEEIGASCFERCDGLTSIEIPNAVTELQGFVFRTCRNLQSVKLPESLTSIGFCALAECVSLEVINVFATTPPIIYPYEPFYNAQYMDVEVNVPTGTKEVYMQADVWKNFWNINDVLSTSIEALREDEQGKSKGIYTINGVKCSTINLSDLPSGTYIMDGKKLYVK